MELIENLMKTGLTRIESELYTALCREGELTGYEAAKITGIPRANAYQALSGLVDKGGAYVIEGSVPHYTAVPVGEYCRNVVTHLQETADRIKQECPQPRQPSEPYITITGFKHISDKIRNMIADSNERIYISLPHKELVYWTEDLKNAAKRGLKVVAIAPAGFEIEGGIIHRINSPSAQVRLIADSSHVITGEINGSDFDACLYSKNKPLVQLIKDSLKNEIRLAELEGERLK
jgi:sugar-specific transcriptional regulator TrmB